MSYSETKPTEHTYQENRIPSQKPISYTMKTSPITGITKTDPVKNKVNTENLKAEESVNTEQDYRGKEDVQKTIKSVYFEK